LWRERFVELAAAAPSRTQCHPLELLAPLWYQCRPMIDRTRFYFWYYAFLKPLAEEGSRSV
jgi:hypothetical protein